MRLATRYLGLHSFYADAALKLVVYSSDVVVFVPHVGSLSDRARRGHCSGEDLGEGLTPGIASTQLLAGKAP